MSTETKTGASAPNSNLVAFQKNGLVGAGQNGRPVTTSLIIAEKFEKKHKNVLRDIQRLEMPEDFNRLNFEPSDYINERGKKYPMYLITRDGFALLAMGFTGKKAMKWKIEYITAFNRMEAALKKESMPDKRLIFGSGFNFAHRLSDMRFDMDDLARICWYRSRGLTQKETALLMKSTRHRISEAEKMLKTADITFESINGNKRFRKTALEVKYRLGLLPAPKKRRLRSC